MCSKTCHLVNAPLITQVKTTALGALDPPLSACLFLAREIRRAMFCFVVDFFFFVDVHPQHASQKAPDQPPAE